jgi:hypothetical protein
VCATAPTAIRKSRKLELYFEAASLALRQGLEARLAGAGNFRLYRQPLASTLAGDRLTGPRKGA